MSSFLASPYLNRLKSHFKRWYTGRKRRMGFGRRGKTSFTVHRSEEVLPGDVRLSKQGSSASSDGEGSADGDRLAANHF